MAKNLRERRNSLMYIKVGSFFLVAFFLFFVTLLSIREVNVFKGSYNFTVKFEFTEGLRISSPVRYCGVDVGEVKKVTVKEEGTQPLVFVKIKIQKDIRIPKDSYIFINSLSLFGEKYLEITPPQKVTGYVKAEEVVVGISPVPLFSVVAGFAETMEEIKGFVEEGKIKTSVENILNNMEEASLSLNELIRTVHSKQGTIGKLFYDDSLYKTAEEFIRDIKAHPWKLLHKPKESRKR